MLKKHILYRLLLLKTYFCENSDTFSTGFFEEHLFDLTFLGPYDFHDAENADRIAESSQKNDIYCITWYVTEFSQFWMNKPRVGQLNWIRLWYGLGSVNIKPQKKLLNMNPAYSECKLTAQIHRVVYYTYWSARDSKCIQRLPSHQMRT